MPTAYLLCAVLHDWADEPARAILRRGAEAVRGTDGRVLVVEKAGPGGARVPSSAMDLRVLVYFGARERDVPALVALADGTGLRDRGDVPRRRPRDRRARRRMKTRQVGPLTHAGRE